MQLTTNWQSVAKKRFEPGTGFIADFYIEAKYSTQNKETAKTTVQTRLRCDVIQGSGGGTGYAFGLTYANSISGDTYWNFEDEIILLGESEVEHNQDGTKTITLSANARVNYTGLDINFSGQTDLPKIARYPLMTKADDFNDEQNPKIYFSNAGVFSLRAKLSVNDTDIATRNLSDQNASSYEFELTTAERNQLRTLATEKKLVVTLSICAVNNGTIINTSSLTATMSIVNATPSITSYTVEETNSKVITLLGGNTASTIVNDASVLSFSITPSAKKSATITNVSIVSGGVTYQKTTSPYTFSIPVTSNTFYVPVTDSRGNYLTYTDNSRTLISYEKLKISSYLFKRQNPTSSNIILNATFVYYSTLNGVTNTPVVKWKLDNGDYTTIPSTNYVIDSTNHTLKITNYTLSNVLNYKNKGQFTLYINDLLTEAQDGGQNGLVSYGVATYDYGENDFQVNGTLYVANTDRTNKRNVLEELDDMNTFLTTVSTKANMLGMYSVNENAIGVAFGKILYRKCLEGTGTLPATLATGITGTIDDIIRFDVFIKRSTNSEWRPLPWIYNSSSYDPNWTGGVFLRENTIYFQAGASLSSTTKYIVILEYTKV